MRLVLWLIVAALAALAVAKPFGFVWIQGDSMDPVLKNGQVVNSRRLDHLPYRGEVVVFKKDGVRMVKRVAFVAGDQFPIFQCAGEWYPAMTEKALDTAVAAGWPAQWVEVPKGTVYVVGDNWTQSTDSRHYGPVPVEDVESFVPEVSMPHRTPFAGARLSKGLIVARLY